MTDRMDRRRAPRSPLATYQVRFPFGLTIVDAARLFAVLADQRQVAFELLATSEGLTYFLSLPAERAATTRRQLLAVLPQVGLVPVTSPSYAWRSATELHATVTDVTEPGTLFTPTLLASFADLTPGEVVMVQVVMAPLAVATNVSNVFSDASNVLANTSNVFASNLFAMDATMNVGLDAACLPCVIRVAVAGPAGRCQSSPHHGRRATSPPDDRVAELLERVQAVYRPLGVTKLRVLRAEWLRRLDERAPAPVRWPQVLSPTAVAILAGTPIGSPAVTGLELGRSKQLVAHPAIPTTGRPVAISTFGGDAQPLTLTPEDRLRGLYVVGPLGSGKTTVLENLIAGDMAEGYGLTVIDYKGGPTSLVERVLNLVPRDRLADVVVFDVDDTARPVGFNVLAGDNPVRITSELTSLLDKLFDFSTSTPRALDVLRSTILTLAEAGLTLVEVAVILEAGPRGDRFRDRVLPVISNPELASFWRWYRLLSDRDKSEVAAPILRRLRSLLLYPQLRLSLGQRASAFDLDDILATGKILLVPLARGPLGDELAQMVGSLMVTKLWAAVQRRADARPYFWVIDEFQELLRHVPTTAGEMASMCRGYGVGMCWANQHVKQLGERMRDEVFADLRSKVVFQTDIGTRELAAQLGRGVTPEDVQALGAYEVFARLHVDGQTLSAATAGSLRPLAGPGLGQAVRAASRTRYGRAPEDIEQELTARHDGAGLPAAGEGPGAAAADAPGDWAEGWEPWDD